MIRIDAIGMKRLFEPLAEQNLFNGRKIARDIFQAC